MRVLFARHAGIIPPYLYQNKPAVLQNHVFAHQNRSAVPSKIKAEKTAPAAAVMGQGRKPLRGLGQSPKT